MDQNAQTDHERLLKEIADYCDARGLKPSTLGTYALGNSRFVERLVAKGQEFAEDAEAVRKYMRNNPPAPKPSPVAEALGSG